MESGETWKQLICNEDDDDLLRELVRIQNNKIDYGTIYHMHTM